MRSPNDDQRFTDKVRSTLGMVPNSESVDDDVFLVSFPKSGNTWLRTLVAGVVYGIDPERAPYPLIADVIPGHGNVFYRRYGTPTFFKSHHLPRPEYKRVVYVLRDGRDVMVSYYHHLRAVRGRPIDFMKVAQGHEHLFPDCRWHEHVEAWLANPFGARMMVVRYEDLHRDPVKELRRFCEFVDVRRDEADLQLVAEKASFEKMRAKEARHGIGIAHWPRDQFSIRRGDVGSYRDEMPGNVLEAFVKDAGVTLRRLGYV
jgi:hypothetical protein